MKAIGIDIGGTSIKGAVISDRGEVGEVFSLKIIHGEPQEITITKLGNLVNEYIKNNHLENEIVGIGMGVPGTIDSVHGIVGYSNNLVWENFHISELMESITHLPVRITNDANAAALGEATFGAGKDYDSAILLTLGTGVGGGIVINHQLIEGNEGKGAELGHITLVLNGRPCSCGRKGCLEQYASATALIRDAKEALSKHPESLMQQMVDESGEMTGRIPFEAAKKGDKTANEVIDQYVMYLGEGCLNYCNIFRPDVIILSGGLANAGAFLFDKVNVYVKNQNYGFYGESTPSTKVIPATLGYDSGKVGAACLFFTK